MVMGKSTVGFEKIDISKSVSKIMNKVDLLKLGLEAQSIELLSDQEKGLLVDIIQYGMRNKAKTKIENVSLESLYTFLEAIRNRREEVYDFLYNDEATSDYCISFNYKEKRSNLVLEIIGTYAYYLSNTIEEIQKAIYNKPRNFNRHDKKGETKVELWFSTNKLKAEDTSTNKPKAVAKDLKQAMIDRMSKKSEAVHTEVSQEPRKRVCNPVQPF